MNRRLLSSLRSWIGLDTGVFNPHRIAFRSHGTSYCTARHIHTTLGSRCSNCGSELRGDCGLSLIKCSSCSNLLAPPSTVPDYYSLFCLPASFKVDASGLRHQFLKLQRLLHPDNFSLANEETKDSSARWSSFLNKAYEILKDPQKRAIYLYQLRSGKSFDEEATLDANTSVNELSEMLQDILDIRMELEECQDPGYVRDILHDNANRMNLVYRGLERAFEASDWDEVKALLIELRYWKSIETVGCNVLAELER